MIAPRQNLARRIVRAALLIGLALSAPAAVGGEWDLSPGDDVVHTADWLRTDSSYLRPVYQPDRGRRGPQGDDARSSSGRGRTVAGNPAASNDFVGTGWLGDYLGLNRNGFRFAGLSIGDANGLTGGLVPGWTGDTLSLAELSIDLEEAVGWRNGLFGIEFLYYSGGAVNSDAGSVMGYNSLDAGEPDNRAELYELWYRHSFFNDRLIIRIGKSNPMQDFNNINRTTSFADPTYNIAALSGLIYTPMYVSPTMLGIMPGYYNTATGVTTTLVPIENTYVNYGLFDGNLANGRQTGLQGPHFNGYALHLLEVGCNWLAGPEKKPGRCGVGYWAQTGKLQTDSGVEHGADGMYLFASQRVYYERPDSTDGAEVFFQFAATDTDFVDTHRFFGCGVSYFGLLPRRDSDSCGFGMAYGKMKDDPAAGLGADEIILSWYYQWMVSPNCFLQPNLTYIPNPAAETDIPGAFPVTLRAILLF